MVGPVLDADGVAVTGGVVGDLKISKNGGAPAALDGSATLTHRHTGFYSLALTAADMDTLGTAQVTIDDTVNTMPMAELTVMDEAMYDFLYTAGGVLSLTQLTITNTGGSAIVATSSGGNGHGMVLTGNGTGEGLSANGGATGHGIEANGGNTSGSGMSLTAGGGGSGLVATGVGGNAGITASGGATGAGLRATGGSSGAGIQATGGSTNQNGVLFTGGGSGAGMRLAAGATGDDLVLANEDAPTLAAVFFSNNSTETYASAVAGSVVKEIADNASGGGGTMDANVVSFSQAGLQALLLQPTDVGGGSNIELDSVAGVILEGMAAFNTGRTLAAVAAGSPVQLAATGAWDNGLVATRTLTAGSITSSTFAAGAITAAVVATGAVDADALAADAVTEIAAGMFTVNTGQTYATSVAGSVVKETADNSGGAAATDPLENQVPGSYASGTAGHRLGMLGGVKVTVVSPVSDTGDVSLVRGDAYTTTLGRALTFTDSRDTWPDLTDGVPTLEVGDGVIVATGVVVTATGTGKTVRVELTGSQTEELAEDVYDYNLVVTYPGTGTTAALGGDRATLVTGEVAVTDRED